MGGCIRATRVVNAKGSPLQIAKVRKAFQVDTSRYRGIYVDKQSSIDNVVDSKVHANCIADYTVLRKSKSIKSC